MPEFYDAFISYGRADSKAFATKLYKHLTERGYEVWFDQNDIPLGVDYQQEIDEGLERSHNFIFVMAPHSVNSQYCGLEVERAVARNKRIIPLLHLAELPRETWQSRNPAGTDEEWAEYQEQKLHFGDVRNPRLHPILGKINWIYGQEGMDDFDGVIAGLVEIFERHKAYVQSHTEFLIRALEWEQQQRRSQFLLVGADRQTGEAWLKQRFGQEQPPCAPIELQAEYINESIKNANNLMTEVFLSYAQEDKTAMEKIRRSLWMEGITVWTNVTDIQTGEEFEAAIRRGIEQADNIVYLLSPNSVKSNYCKLEFDYATALNQRIIPVLVEQTPLEEQPEELQGMQYIDLTDNEREEDYLLDESQLLKILRTDALYHQTHKVLRSKAMKWEQQHQNPSLLLRGFNLREAETWLKTAQQRSNYKPTDLQTTFLDESLRQPPAASLDVFVSYSRADSDFARKLNDSLQVFGKLTWFDQESIATSSADFQQEIYRGIETSDNFLFILSPESVNSEYCAGEVEYAAKLNKRFITVLHREVDPATLHPELAKVQWLDFNKNDGDFRENFNQLVRALETDREHVHSHTKWSQRAIEWEQKNRTKDLLLRGSEYILAQNWLELAHNEKKQPTPTELQEIFLKKSEEAIAVEERKEKRQKTLLRSLAAVMTGVAFIAIGTSIWALDSQKKAKENEQQSLQSEAESLLALSDAEFAQEQHFTSLLTALEATSLLQEHAHLSSQDGLRHKSIQALQQSINSVNEYQTIKEFNHLATSSNRQILAFSHDDGIVKLWNLAGEELNTLDHGAEIYEVVFSPDDQTLISYGYDSKMKLWNSAGEELQTLDHGSEIYEVVFHPDSQMFMTLGDTDMKVWNLAGEELQIFQHDDSVLRAIFNLDGQILASAEHNQVKLWNLAGEELHTLEHDHSVSNIVFSPDGQILASIENNQVKLWNLAGKELQTLEHDGSVSNVVFSPDGQTLASIDGDFSKSEEMKLRLWSRTGEELYVGDSFFIVSDVTFSPDGQFVTSNSSDQDGNQKVELLSLNGETLHTFEHESLVSEIKFSPDGQTIITAGKKLKLWNLFGEELRTFDHGSPISEVMFSPDGETIISNGSSQVKLWSLAQKERSVFAGISQSAGSRIFVSEDAQTIAALDGSADNSKVQLLDITGELISTFDHGSTVSLVSFSPDGQTIASVSGNEVKLWNLAGEELHTLDHGSSNVTSMFGSLSADTSVLFSPDSQQIATVGSSKVKLWNLAGEQLHTFDHESPLLDVEFSPDSQSIVSSGEDGLAKLWKSTREQLHTFDHGDFTLQVTFSPDGQTIASGGNDGTVKLWNLAGEELYTLKHGNKAVFIVNFSPDGQTLASSDLVDGKVKIWNLAGEKLYVLDHGSAAFTSFSTNGQIITTFGPDGKVKVWNLTGEELYTLDHGSSVDYVQWIDDSNTIISGSHNGKIKVWDLDLNTLVTRGCEWIESYLMSHPSELEELTICQE